MQLVKSPELDYDSTDNIEIKQLIRFKDNAKSI